MRSVGASVIAVLVWRFAMNLFEPCSAGRREKSPALPGSPHCGLATSTLSCLSRRGCRLGAGGRPSILGLPGHGAPVIFEAFGMLQRVLRRVHHELPFVVVLRHHADGIEGDRHVLLAGAEEAANADDERGSLPSRLIRTSLTSPILLSLGS